MAFLESRISIAVRRGSKGGPVVDLVALADGAGRLRAQRFLRSVPLQRFSFDFGNKLLDDAEAIRSFLYVVFFSAPPYEGFRVRDWNDYELTQANSRLTLISGNAYQINRVYAAGAATALRPIYKLEASAVVYRTRGGTVTVATASVNANTGVATISGHVDGDTYTVVANFDIPVTFENDEALADIALDGNVENILLALGNVELEELPGPWT
jgi:uncharacterized protein (TIGR02217 family)